MASCLNGAARARRSMAAGGGEGMDILVEQVGNRVYRCVSGHAKFRSELRDGRLVKLTDVETREEVRAYKSPEGVMILRPIGAEIAETRAVSIIEGWMRESKLAEKVKPRRVSSWRGRSWPRFG